MARNGHVADPDLEARRDAILASMARHEASIAGFVAATLITCFIFARTVAGESASFAQAIPDVIQIIVFTSLAWLLSRGTVSDAALPRAIATALSVGVVGQGYDYSVNAEQWPPVFIIIMAGTLVLAWRPFWISVSLCSAYTAAQYLRLEPEHGASWASATVVAALVAAGTLRARRSAAHSLAAAQLAVERAAVADPLTGLLNRRGLAREVRFVRGVARRASDQYFAMFVDIGGLKRMNDLHGHDAGDRLLMAVAAALQRVARETDLVCRWGGDEFLLVGAGARPDPAALTRRVLAAMDVSALPEGWDPVLWVGAAESESVDEDLREVIVRADDDLYALRSAHPDGATR